LGSSNTKFAHLKNRAPQIIAAVILIVIGAYVVFELLEDVFIESAPPTSGPLISAILSFTHNVKDTVTNWGYSGIFGLMVLESSSLPVPSEVVLPFAGYLISRGQGNLDFVLTVLVATVAAIVGSLVDYYIGLKGIEALTKRKVLGRVFFSTDQLTFAGKWFSKYGAIVVFLARLIPGLRTIISFPAGAAKMPIAKFVAFTTAGCGVWNAVLIYVGIYLGNNWREVANFSEYILIGVIVALAALAVVYLMVRRRKRKRQLNTQVSQPLKV
jgi:membrane protein DedA with SNARE-associated domain